MAKIKIYVCHHKDGPRFSNDVFVPIQVGRAGAPVALPMIGDDTGRNISQKNRTWCELTALYWARHNSDADFIGLAQYRRLPVFRSAIPDKVQEFYDGSPATQRRFGWTAGDVARVCAQYDVVTLPRLDITLPGHSEPVSHIEQYAYYHFARDLDEALRIIRTDHPDFHPRALKVLQSNKGFFANVMVMRRDHFLAYTDWVMDILQKLEQAIDTSGYDEYQQRVFGFVAERLANVYVDYLVEQRGARHRELPLAYGIFNYRPVSASRIAPVSAPRGGGEALITDDRIQVAFAIDAGYSAHCATAIASMLSHLHPEQGIDVHILSDGALPQPSQLGLTAAAAASPQARIVFHDIDVARFAHLPLNRQHVSVTTYFRLVLQHVLPVDRVIYLDSDLLVLDNIAQLWAQDMDGMPVAACPDEGGVTQSRRLRLAESHPYFNGGVLLLDLGRLRKEDADAAYREAYAGYRERIILQDQDILNIAFAGRTKRLDLRWNAQSRLFAPNKFDFVYSQREAEAASENPAIVHFTDAVKPWKAESRHPYVGLYWQFRDMTFFRPGHRERAAMALKRVVVRFPLLSGLLVRLRDRLRVAASGR